MTVARVQAEPAGCGEAAATTLKSRRAASLSFCSKIQDTFFDKSSRCRKNVVYVLRLSCGRKYIGETSRCWKTRVLEHTNQSSGIVRKHVSQCGCHIVLNACYRGNN